VASSLLPANAGLKEDEVVLEGLAKEKLSGK
jgi:hypothetical protein